MPIRLTPTQKGAVAELAVASHAARLGIAVLRPLTEGLRYDLILDFGQRLCRVQCKYANVRGQVVVVRLVTCRHTPAGPVKTHYGPGEIDAIAVYCAELDRCFLVPIERAAGLSQLHLRLAPARNNQQALVTMADEYDLGAIAQLGERRAGSAKVAGSSPASSTASPEATRTGGLSS